MTVRIGTNGFGRIGRSFWRAARARTDVEVVAVNDPADPKPLPICLRYDSVRGRLDKLLTVHDGYHGGRRAHGRYPVPRSWDGAVGRGRVDVVVECTGRFLLADDVGALQSDPVKETQAAVTGVSLE